MNISVLSTGSLKILGHNGICISPEKARLIQNSILILQQENHFRKAFYWGRINGVQNDYHIAYGYEKDCLDGQIYFYSLDLVDWSSMPKSNKCGRFLTPLAVTAFEGDPSIVTNIYNTNPALVFSLPDRDSTKPDKKGSVVPKELKEEDRLAATVELINREAMIIPRGGWFKRPSGEMIENLAFEGLTVAEALDEKYYFHARAPQRKWNANLPTTPDYNYAIDFLDSIDADVPKGCCWSLQLDRASQSAILRSSYWPGMTFYHKTNTPHYGALYVGDGKKNLDVPFMN